MNMLNGLLDSISASFKGGTKTGLDLLDASPTAALVVKELVNSDQIPATRREVISAFTRVLGRSPREEELIDIEGLLLSFGWLA